MYVQLRCLKYRLLWIGNKEQSSSVAALAMVATPQNSSIDDNDVNVDTVIANALKRIRTPKWMNSVRIVGIIRYAYFETIRSSYNELMFSIGYMAVDYALC